MKDRFVDALLDPGQPVPDGLCDAAARPAGRRFDIYRNNVAYSLTEALRVGFPVVTRVLGRQNMDRLAGVYLRAHPPCDPRMMFYGAAFPDFLGRSPQVAHLGYLRDVARLELALRHAYHAGDATPMAPEALAEIATEALMQARFVLAPAVRLVRSDWPILDIWRDDADIRANPGSGAQDVLITRPEFDPVPQLLLPGGAVWIQALMEGQSLSDALDTAQAETPQFDMAAPLTLLLLGRALISLT